MPKLHHLEKLTDNLSIGVQIGKNTDKTPSKSPGMWTARFNWPRRSPAYRSLKLRYEDGSETNKAMAQARAYEIASELAPAAGAGLDYHKVNYLNNIAEEYLLAIEEYTTENEQRKNMGQAMRHKVHGGNAYWNKDMLKQTTIIWRKAIFPFFEERLAKKKIKSRRTKGGKGLVKTTYEYSHPILRNVNKRDWDQFDDYMIESPELDYGVQYRLKCVTALRKFLSWCYAKQYTEDVPSIKRPSLGGIRGTRERMRREIRPEEYTDIINYQRSQYLDLERPLYYRQFNYLFHLWTLIIANTGIRPPTGSTEHTLMKWQHVKLGDKPTLLRPEEKRHSYEAVIMPNAVFYFEELQKFYKQNGMPTDTGYVFAHWRDQGDLNIHDNVETYTTKARNAGAYGKLKEIVLEAKETKPAATYRKQLPHDERGELRWKIGDPIKSFRAQWNKMIRALDLYVPGGQQSKNISPSSLRAWFITQRLYSDKNFRIEELARVTGTSVGQIEERYFRLDMDRSYDHLTAGGYDRTGKKPTYTRDGMYAGFK